MDESTHIALAYQDPLIDSAVVSGFDNDLQSTGLRIQIEPVPFMQYRAGIEWLLPTAIVAYLAKPYFESFLREMGKDHYNLLKLGLTKLLTRISARYGERLKIVSSKGKVSANSYEYSPIFSIEAASGERHRYKLLIQPDISEEEFQVALDAFLNLMCQRHGIESPSTDDFALLNATPIGSVVLVALNLESGKLELIDPIPKKSEP